MTLEHISYSQYKSYTSCPRSWYLSKVVQAEEVQTWYLPIGTAVHSMIEYHLDSGTSRVPTAEEFFYPLVEKQMLIEPDLSKWLAGGPEDRPIKEELALEQVRVCFEQALEELDEVDVWEVEYDASGRLPSLEVPIKAFVDIVGEHKKRKRPTIWDWKTGSTKPDNFQLETYAALMGGKNMGSNWQGRYVMLAPGTPNTRYVDLRDVNPAEVGAKYQEVYEKMQQKIYKAKPGFGCRYCFNQENCLANKGPNPRTQYYDRSAEDGIPY